MNPNKPLPYNVCILIILVSSIVGWLALARLFRGLGL